MKNLTLTDDEFTSLELQKALREINDNNIVDYCRTKNGLFICEKNFDGKSTFYSLKYKLNGGVYPFERVGYFSFDATGNFYLVYRFENNYGQLLYNHWKGDKLYNRDFMAFMIAACYHIEKLYFTSFSQNPF